MSAIISPRLRHLVMTRANHRCEYCLLPEAVALHRHEPDHIIPLQHGGVTEDNNMACACFRCNRHKGPNIGSYDPVTGLLTPLYHPRRQTWSDHFKLNGARIEPLTPEGRVTVFILQLNAPERVRERDLLLAAGYYP